MNTLSHLLNFLSTCPEFHRPNSKQYKYLKQISKSLSDSLFGSDQSCVDEWEKVGKIQMPYFEMGNINSSHLFGIDELIIFSYYIINFARYKNAIDIGANIGLHSIILSKLGINTKSFEPDPVHMKKLKKNFYLNGIKDKIEPYQYAISNQEKQLEFCRVVGNTTGSHLVGSKENPYGELEYFLVNSKNVKEFFFEADLIKLDAEGHEDVILCSLNISDWKNQEVFVEVGSFENAKKIFDHFFKTGINLFSQKEGWKKVNKIQEMPFSYKEGSLFISKEKEMYWNS